MVSGYLTIYQLFQTKYKDLKNYIFELVRCEGEKGIFCYEYFFSINHLDNIMKWAKTITDIDYKDFKRLDEDINKLHLPGMPLLYELIGEYVSEMLYLLFKI